MFDLDQWQEIRVALAANKLRTLLTAFGIFWGIFLLVVMLGAGHGLENGVKAGFSGGVTNSFFVWTMATSKPFRGLPSGRRIQLTNEDVEAIRQQVPEAQVVAPRNQLGGWRGGNNVTRGNKAGGFSVMGDYPQILALQSNQLQIVAGRFLNQPDLEERRKVAVIGTSVRDLLFEPEEGPIGESIEINGVYFKVIGVLKSMQSGERGERDAQTVFVPFTTFQQAFNFGNRVGWLAVTSRPEVPASVVEEKVLELLRQRQKVAPDDRRGFGHFNLEEEYQKIQNLFLAIEVLVWVVGIGTLAAGAIGVSNIMLIVVKERTKEIGIRRAVGARPRAIIAQVVLEAVILTAVAGYLGLVAGVGVVEVVDVLATRVASDGPNFFQNPEVDLSDALQALSILILAGMLAGLAPAQRAVAVRPVEALRSE